VCCRFFSLSSRFSSAFAVFVQCKVIENEVVNESRLLLCEAAAVAMRQAFKLLGIKPLMQI
jgi:arginyl-tRNA synthetase